MGVLPIPNPPVSGTVTYLLDGHQRLATLYSVLRLPANHTREGDEGWKWWIYYDLSSETEEELRFVHVPPERVPAPYFLPLRSMVRTMDFLAFSQDMALQVRSASLAKLMRRAESLVQRVKSYKLSTLRISGGTTEEAATIFNRLNRVGAIPPPDDEGEP